ncbi:aldo/keto reductase [Halomontanus rarus]|uniref:aldo/keto reductase n=1 Tax=Halomontanus rarus TaxID=3034020 RepID=UPI001A999D90
MPNDELPDIGLGTWQNTDPERCARSVATALDAGYRHVDTAQHYGNEEHVGDGIAAASVRREEVTVATKVHPEDTGLGYDDVLGAAATSCDRLGVDYLDLLYVHWPVGDYEASETLAALEELVDRGTVGHIGVSNFSVDLLEEARAALDDPLFAHQVEMHPLLQQRELVAYAQEHGHYLVAYSPLARGTVTEIPEIQAVAEKHAISEPQVSLAWLLSKDNVVVIPKSATEAHITANLQAANVELDEEDIAAIDDIDREERFVERPGAPWLDG